jgi:hypothetical protein
MILVTNELCLNKLTKLSYVTALYKTAHFDSSRCRRTRKCFNEVESELPWVFCLIASTSALVFELTDKAVKHI